MIFLVFPVRMKARTLAWTLGLFSVAEAVLVQSQIAHSAHLAGGLAGYLYARRLANDFV
jgi:membrane associated rhomboid family serine protease